MSTPHRLTTALADRYLLERELGQGGMATVYLAEDLKHKRKVALKVLKPELAAVLGAERFVQEITTTAALQHPHILPLFDSGSVYGPDKSGPYMFYVMPFIDGETLRTKLDRETQLGIEESVRIASDVASALHYAHQQGVIHRDIKPENILLHEGRPMVADFGIALAVSAAAGGRMTETGLSLGTPHYMSPEQATAEKEITARSDVYSLGSVLYEMLTGEPPHMGNSAQQIIMKIIAEDAQAVTRLRKSVPRNVAAAVAKSLEKLPADRFESAKAFGEALGNPAFASTSSVPVASMPGTRRAGVLVLGLAATALGVLAAAGWMRSPELPPTGLFDFGLQGISALGQVAISGDGSTFVLPGVGPNGQVGIFVRGVDSRMFTAIPGTEDVQSVALPSDDGSAVLYTTERGSVISVTRAGNKRTIRGGEPGVALRIHDWRPDGTVLFSTDEGLFRHTESGDETIDSSSARQRYGHASLLPDGGILIGGASGLRVIEPDGSVTTVMEEPTNGVYLDNGWLLINQQDVLSAAPFSLKKRTLDTRALVEVASGLQTGFPRAFSASRTGTIVLALGATAMVNVLELVDPSGSRRLLTAADVGRSGPRFDATGAWLSFHRQDANGPAQLWMRNVEGENDDETQLTFEGRNLGGAAVWSPRGRRLIFASEREGSDGTDLYLLSVDSPGTEKQVLSLPGDQRPLQWLPGNQILVYSVDSSTVRGLLLTLSLESGVLDTFPELPGGPDSRGITTWGATVSSDGLIAFRSEFRGTTAFWVREYPSPSGRVRVPETPGFNPAWSQDGKTLYSWVQTLGPDTLIAVTVDRTAGGIRFSNRRPVHVSEYRGWELHPDGRRFVVTNPATVDKNAGQVWREFGVLINWSPEQ